MKKDAKLLDHYVGMPKSVRVGNYEFIIEMMDAGDSAANSEFGHCNLINQKIRMSPDMSPRKLANCFLHEVIHAIHWFFNIADDDHSEEDFTLLGANGLCMFWQDNPETMAWWVGINAHRTA